MRLVGDVIASDTIVGISIKLVIHKLRGSWVYSLNSSGFVIGKWTCLSEWTDFVQIWFVNIS